MSILTEIGEYLRDLLGYMNKGMKNDKWERRPEELEEQEDEKN